MEDLIANAFADPAAFDILTRGHMLGTPSMPADDARFMQSLKVPVNVWPFRNYWVPTAADNKSAGEALCTPSACKYMLCDTRIPPDAAEDAEACLEAAYQEQLRMEREGDRLEKAREQIRTKEWKRARRHARAILREFDAAAERGEEQPTGMDIWKGIRPKTPSWVTEILSNGQKEYGYALFTTKEANARPHIAHKRWMKVFDEWMERHDNFSGYKARATMVWEGEKLRDKMHVVMVEAVEPSETDPATMRSDFREMRDVFPHKWILNNTFLVLTDDCIFPELDTHRLEWRAAWRFERSIVPEERADGVLLPGDVPRFHLWAYDAEWEPPAGEQADEDGYEGRVRLIRICCTPGSTTPG
jgi:nucleoside diphosphate kinase